MLQRILVTGPVKPGMKQANQQQTNEDAQDGGSDVWGQIKARTGGAGVLSGSETALISCLPGNIHSSRPIGPD